MEIHPFTLYRTANIGIFLRANDHHILVPRGVAPTKAAKLSRLLGVKPVQASIGGSRLLGPLIAMNNRGVVVSRMVEDFELEELRRALGIRVAALPSRYTSVGNLVVANDKGALASPILDREALRLLEEVLQVPVHITRVAGYIQVGAVVVATNTGCVAHPEASDEELKALSEWLRVPATPATVNDGVPFLASGIVANNRGIVVGSATSGPELMILSRAFQT